ncbi:MAG: hypothetical protein ACT4ON_15890 [Bacteroidota bacterium]
MKKIIYLLLILISFAGMAQENSAVMNNYQDTLQTICKNLYDSKNDADRQKHNQQLLLTFEKALNTTSSFDYPFDSLKKDMAVLRSTDNKFRIINWYVPKEDGTYEYYGFIQVKVLINKKETVQLYPLIDRSTEIKNPENAITDNKKWFGAWYYKIIPKKTKTKTYYTLLGRAASNKISQKKIIDVLTFDNNGTPHFGADIFSMQKKYPKRVIFEYSATCSMSLKYNEKKDSIIFDHLDAPQLQLVGQFQYYCGDFTYDGFGFKKGKWNFGTNLMPANEKDYKDKLYKDPEKASNKNESNTLKDLKNIPYSEPQDKNKQR